MSDIRTKETGRLDRRDLLRMGGAAGIGVLATTILAGCGGDSDDDHDSNGGGGGGTTRSDIDILNFALNLEYLEAEYYLRGVTGSGLSAADSGSSAGTVTGGRAVSLSGQFRPFFEELADDEQKHVRALRSTLGGSAVSRPAINFTDAFNAAARAAGLGTSFDPFANEINFLIGSFVFEDVGVTAYNGAAPLISSKAVLRSAAGILAVEAYHAGTIRTLIYRQGGAAVNSANEISDLRASVGGGKDQGLNEGVGANIVPADANAIAFARSTREVLNIVYLQAGANRGGFFPNGLNGVIR